jgi:hypothetical protein
VAHFHHVSLSNAEVDVVSLTWRNLPDFYNFHKKITQCLGLRAFLTARWLPVLRPPRGAVAAASACIFAYRFLRTAVRRGSVITSSVSVRLRSLRASLLE